MSDLAERLEALTARNDAPLPSTYPATDEEAKERFLFLLGEGMTPPQAAAACGKTATWFKRRRNPQGSNYDEDFSDRYDEIMRPGGEHQQAMIENARAALIEAAKSGNVRAIEKILMAYDPDFEFLRPAAFQSNTWNVEKMVQIMPGIPTELLEQMIEVLEEQKMRELPVIDQ